MLQSLLDETLLYGAFTVLSILFLGSQGMLYLLGIAGLVLRPFRRQPVAFLYPWGQLWGKPPSDVTGTFYNLSSLMVVHTLWLVNTVVVWIGLTLYCLDIALNELFPDLVGIEDYTIYGEKVPTPVGYAILAMYAGLVAIWSSWMWVRSMHRSLANHTRMSGVMDGGDHDDLGHYLAPFRKATVWAIATWPLLFGFAVLTFVMMPPFQG